MNIKHLKLVLVMVGLVSLLSPQPSIAQTGDNEGADLEHYRVSGVLISETRKAVLVNGRSVREGAMIGNAVVEVIEKRQIRIRTGSERRIVRIGGSFTAAPSQDSGRQVMVVSRSTLAGERGSSGPVSRSTHVVAAGHSVTNDEVSSNPGLFLDSIDALESLEPGGHREHVVADGDTLSGIALRYRPDGVTGNQMMIAIFEANPSAFDGNINALRAGTTLRVPDPSTAGALAPDLAMLRVVQHYESWRDPHATATATATATAQLARSQPGSDVANSNPGRTYGPVRRGATLSEIASAINAAEDGHSDEQVMIALYRENPHAFGDSINVLYEGVRLTIPHDSRIAGLPRADAAAEVERQLAAARAPVRPGADDDPDFDIDTVVSVSGPIGWMHRNWRTRSPH